MTSVSKSTFVLGHRHLLGIEGLSAADISGLLALSEEYVELNRQVDKKRTSLRGRTQVNLFFEASTRTQSSFEIAGKRLGADVMNMSVGSSSMRKGETLIDTAVTLNAMRPDLIVVRHGAGVRTIAAPAAPASASDSSPRATVVERGTPEVLPGTGPPPRFRKFDLSGDGEHVAFVAEGPRIDDRGLYYRRLSAGRNKRLRTRGVVSDDEPLTISADGRLIAYHDDPAGGSVVDTRTGTRRELGCDENGRSCLWKLGVDQGRFASSCEEPVVSANGRLVACRSSEPRVGLLDPSTPRGIVTRSLVTGRMTCALCAPLPDTPDTPIPQYDKLALSRDGRMIAYVTERTGQEGTHLTDVYVLNTRTGQTTLVSRQSGPVT